MFALVRAIRDIEAEIQGSSCTEIQVPSYVEGSRLFSDLHRDLTGPYDSKRFDFQRAHGNVVFNMVKALGGKKPARR